MINSNLNLEFCESTNIVVAKAWIREGSRSDPKNKKGLHQLLAASLTRGCGEYDSDQIADIIESSGAYLRSDANEDGILISMKCTQEDHLKLLPIIKLMISSPKLNKEQIKLEKELTIQAIKRQKENPYQLAYKSWKKLVYNKTDYEHDTLGTIYDIENTTLNDLECLAKELICREKVIVIKGGIDKKGVEEIFGDSNKKNNRIKVSDTTLQLSKVNSIEDSKITLETIDSSQVVIMYGNKSTNHSNNDDINLRVLSCHLGSGMSSVLFKRLREQNGLAYDVGIYNPIREYNTPFIIHCSTNKTKAVEAYKHIKDSLHKTFSNELTNEQLELAKTKLISSINHHSQTIAQKSERMAILLGYGMKEDFDVSCIEHVKSLTSKDIMDTANKYLDEPYLSLCGSEEGLQLIKNNL